MTSSAAAATPCKGGVQMLPRPPESDAAAISITPKWPSSRRSTTTTTSSHSYSLSLSSTSSSSSSSSSDNDSPPIPSTPLRPPTTATTTGIPFSWEKLPGIPKKQIINNSNPSVEIFNSLPLPPIPCHKFSYAAAIGDGFRRDPFLAALLECSKEEGCVWRSTRKSSSSKRSGNSHSNGAISGRPFSLLANFNLTAYSCKSSCGVVESMVFVPRSTRVGYNFIDKSSRR